MILGTDLSCKNEHTSVVPLVEALVPASELASTSTSWERRFSAMREQLPSAHSLRDIAAGDTLADVDAVVLPIDWYWVRGNSWASRPDRKLAARCGELARAAELAGKPLVAFFSGDRSCDHVDLPGATVMREGPYRSRCGPLDRAIPAFAEDLTEHFLFGASPWRAKAERPVVSFCGLARSLPMAKRMPRLLAYHLTVLARERHLDPSPYLGELLRTSALAQLAAHQEIDTRFIIRQVSTFFRTAAAADLVDVRREYVENMIDSDYVLCVRGSGNYSFRLYEALSMGRIPILLDTDCELPFSSTIDWHRHCVWIRPEEREHIADIVLQFHRSISPEAFADVQRANRQLWLDYLSPVGFFSRLAQVLGGFTR